MVQIGKLIKVPLREIWKKEDKDFTTWLEENIDYLNDILDFDITVEKREEKVGSFKVDLLGTDSSGNKIIIENQLEKTNHDHLGKLLTYLINLDARVAIWITSEPVKEHVKVIDWLNENAPEFMSFYLIKIEAVKIESQPLVTPLFTIVAQPTEEAKAFGLEKKEFSKRLILRKQFWTQLLDKAKDKTTLHSNISPTVYSWIGTSAGKSGISYVYIITYKYGGCEVYLDKGKEFAEPNINKIRFDKLVKHKDEIESGFGGNLNWERLDNKMASRISFRFNVTDLLYKDKWDNLQNKMIDIMIRLEKAFKKYVEKLN